MQACLALPGLALPTTITHHLGSDQPVVAMSLGGAAINEPGHWDVFISHSQRDANAVALAVELYFSLKERGHAVWLDVKMNKRDVAAIGVNCEV